MDDLHEEGLRFRDKTEKARIDFIRTDLEALFTFASIVESAYTSGHREHAERTLAAAENGYSTLLRLFTQARGLTAEVERELESKLAQLRERLDGLRRPGR